MRKSRDLSVRDACADAVPLAPTLMRGEAAAPPIKGGEFALVPDGGADADAHSGPA